MSEVWLISYAALWILFLMLGVAVVALYNHFGQMYLSSREGRSDQGPALGSELKATSVRTLAGETVAFPAPTSSLIAFVSTTCSLCAQLKPEFLEIAARERWLDVVLVCGGKRKDVLRWATDLPGTLRVIPDPNHGIAARHGVGLMPYVVAIDDKRLVRFRGLVNDRKGLESAIDEVVGESAPDRVDQVVTSARKG